MLSTLTTETSQMLLLEIVQFREQRGDLTVIVAHFDWHFFAVQLHVLVEVHALHICFMQVHVKLIVLASGL